MHYYGFILLLSCLSSYFFVSATRRAEDIFRIHVTVDLTSEKPITGYELNKIIEDKIDEDSRIGELAVAKDEFYKLVVVEGNE